jgi:acyl-CoA thioesterase-2
MHPVLDDLITLLTLERIEENIFRGASRDIGSPQVFGGQVLGQALSAAQHTVEGRVAHSLHAYFLRRGDMGAPIIYEVDRARDGGSFSNRRVVAIQHGRPILNLAASFQSPEEGLAHQVQMPDVPAPDGLKDLTHLAADVLDRIPVKLRRFMTDQRPFEFRPVEQSNLDEPKKRRPEKHVWIRAVKPRPCTLVSSGIPHGQVVVVFDGESECVGRPRVHARPIFCPGWHPGGFDYSGRSYPSGRPRQGPQAVRPEEAGLI